MDLTVYSKGSLAKLIIERQKMSVYSIVKVPNVMKILREDKNFIYTNLSYLFYVFNLYIKPLYNYYILHSYI